MDCFNLCILLDKGIEEKGRKGNASLYGDRGARKCSNGIVNATRPDKQVLEDDFFLLLRASSSSVSSLSIGNSNGVGIIVFCCRFLFSSFFFIATIPRSE